MKIRIYIWVFLIVAVFAFFALQSDDAEGPPDVSKPDLGQMPVGVVGEFSSVPMVIRQEIVPDSSFPSNEAAQAGGDEVVIQPAADAEAGADSIPRERLIGFDSRSDLLSFLAYAKGKGIDVIDVLESANAVRVRYDDEGRLSELLAGGPKPANQSGNYYVRLPDDPTQKPLTPTASYVGFGNRSLQWLGIDDGNASWGKGVVVAVLDSGVSDHPVLNGLSIERLNVSGVEKRASGDESMLHGTAMVSLIAGNDQGVAGVAPGASVLSVDVMGAEGTSDSFTLARGIYESVDRGAKVINISMGSPGDSFVLKSAVDYAEANGVAVVASTGNDALSGVLYPARYDSVVAVSGVDALGRHLYFANRGPEVDISAPAMQVAAAGADGSIANISGTSASAAFVSGALAWLMSENPEMSSAEAVQVMMDNANDVDAPGRDEKSGEGVLNIARIRDKDTPGIYDIAVGSPYVTRDENGDVVVTLFVENRGTEPISTVEFAGNVDGRDYYVDYYNVPVGSVESYQILLAGGQVGNDEGVTVESAATIRGLDDSRPLNNVVKGTVISGE